MNIYYLLAVLVSRLGNMVSVLLFSYLLDAASFGTYTAVATNAMLMHLLLGSWVSSNAWRDVSNGAGTVEQARVIGKIPGLSLVAVAVQCAVMLPVSVMFVYAEHYTYAAATLLWSVAILLFETTLVVENSLGRAREYATITLLRGILTPFIALGALLLGWGAWGAIGGSIIAIILSLVFRPLVWSVWQKSTMERPQFKGVLKDAYFGVCSVIALNIYMLVNALLRNVVLLDLGPVEAGHVSLAADIFFAPLALFATALGLSNIPLLYGAAAKNDRETARLVKADFFAGIFAITVPYCIGGAMVAAALSRLILSVTVAVPVAEIAMHAVLQAGCLTLLSALTTIGLTQGDVKKAVGFSLLALVGVAIALFATNLMGGSATTYSIATSITLAIILIAAMISMQGVFDVAFNLGDGLKVVLASAAMAAVIWLIKPLETRLSPFPEILVGVVVFGAMVLLLRINSVRRVFAAATAGSAIRESKK
jgi:O-antigen/teichoic acid export membrane protein